ncbi:hypothetical protein ABBQ38_006431 [Trebouxia sp. C0009 RCD-2024]
MHRQARLFSATSTEQHRGCGHALGFWALVLEQHRGCGHALGFWALVLGVNAQTSKGSATSLGVNAQTRKTVFGYIYRAAQVQ